MPESKTIFAGSGFFLKFIFENSIKASVMKINNNSELPANEVQMEGADKVRMRILIGPGDGSDNIIMRSPRRSEAAAATLVREV